MWRRRHGLTSGRAALSPSGGDASFSSVKLLAGWEGADAATSYTEESSSARVATFGGNAQLDTAQFKFGTSSFLSDGTGDSCTFPLDNAAWVLSPTANSDQFTVETFIRLNTTTPTSQPIVNLAAGNTGNLNSWTFTFTAGNQIQFGISTAGNGGFDVTVTSSGLETRITKGVARYASDGGYTVPTAAFPRN
jgi:hypothetical protein